MTEDNKTAVERYRETISVELQEDVLALRDMWVASGKPEYGFWGVMMGIYSGMWPGGPTK